MAALTAVVRLHRAHIGPGTAASATLSVCLSVPHPTLQVLLLLAKVVFSVSKNEPKSTV